MAESGFRIRRTNNTDLRVEIPRVAHRWQVEHILWFARELEKAVEAGMDPKTEITGLNTSSSTLAARQVLSQEIP